MKMCSMVTPKWKVIMGSRKFWAAVLGLVFVLVKAFWPDFPLEEDQVIPLVVILAAYIFGVAVEDGMRRPAE